MAFSGKVTNNHAQMLGYVVTLVIRLCLFIDQLAMYTSHP